MPGPAAALAVRPEARGPAVAEQHDREDDEGDGGDRRGGQQEVPWPGPAGNGVFGEPPGQRDHRSQREDGGTGGDVRLERDAADRGERDRGAHPGQLRPVSRQARVRVFRVVAVVMMVLHRATRWPTAAGRWPTRSRYW